MDLRAVPARHSVGGGCLGIYSDEEMTSLVAPLANRYGAPILVRTARPRKVRDLRSRGYAAPLVLDCGAWRADEATVHRPMASLSEPGTLFAPDLDTWAAGMLAESKATTVLTPSRFVRSGQWAALRSLVTEVAALSEPNAMPFVPTAGSMLTPALLPTFLDHLTPLADRPVALLFAGGRDQFANAAMITGLRTVLAVHPNTWLLAVDPLIGTDAISCGAGLVFIGARSSLRWPAAPGEANGGFANGFVPGLFNRDLLAMRSPSTYADWYVNSTSPSCAICARPVDNYTASDADKVAIVEHNVHAFHDFASDLLNRPVGSRKAWLQDQRVAAFEAHHRLSRTGATLAADQTLRRLCELDDPMRRVTTPVGTWR